MSKDCDFKSAQLIFARKPLIWKLSNSSQFPKATCSLSRTGIREKATIINTTGDIEGRRPEISLRYLSWAKLVRIDYGKWARSYRPSYRVFVARFRPCLLFPWTDPFYTSKQLRRSVKASVDASVGASARNNIGRCKIRHSPSCIYPVSGGPLHGMINGRKNDCR